MAYVLRMVEWRWRHVRQSLVTPPLLLRGRGISEGQKAPWGWGLAYWRFYTDEAVLYPIPLNWIVRGLRELYFRLRLPKPSAIERAYHRGLHESRRAANNREWTEGFKAGRAATFKYMKLAADKMATHHRTQADFGVVKRTYGPGGQR